MSHVRFPVRGFLLCYILMTSLFVWGQPETITKRDTSEAIGKRKQVRFANQTTDHLEVRNAITFQANRLVNLNFPSATLSYQRFIGNYWGVITSLGLPVNGLLEDEPGSSTFSGIDTRLGLRYYPFSFDHEVRFFIAVDGMHYVNPQEKEGFLREEGKTTYRATNLKLARKRQLLALSIGIQTISYYGLTLDMRAGILAGRRGVFVPGEQPFLPARNINDPLWGGSGPLPDAWGNYYALQLGFAIGYAF